MRLPPRRVNRVVWEEGMFLAPQHFQAQRRHFEECLGHTIDALFPFGYGVTSAALDTEALGGGTLALSHARGIFPDGTAVAVPEADAPPPATSLADRFSPTRGAHLVLLAIPAWQPDAANVAVANGAHADRLGTGDMRGTRYVETVANVRDETSGEDATEIHFAAKRLRLCLDHEVAPTDVTLPVARVRRDGSGRYVVDPDYIAPTLQIGASERLLEILRSVIGMLEAKGASLSASLGPAGTQRAGAAPAAYVGNELATRWLLHAVRSAEAPLRHLLATRRAHPERLWTELSRLSGALCTFSLTTQARDLPTYAHDDLGGCFGALEHHLRTHLDVVVAAKAVVIPLPRGQDTLYGAAIGDPRCFDASARWFLGVRSALSARDTIVALPQLSKVCARRFVLELTRRAIPGFTLEHVPSPPAGLAPRAELTYFEVVRAGPCDTALTATKEIGVYVPDSFGEAVFELAVLVAE
ncbi:MAG TPA: type VI secretion system baseplate subunit TssK [Gemmatimonadaceae bacterium]|nr:type VI secretion system baseplate subunit TssK [Gemmatimonadaceae bacterium]